MKILVLGSGAREDAIVRSLLAETPRPEVIVSPGNAGISALAQTIEMDINDGDVISDYAIKNNIDLVIVGPEAPLAAGVANEPRERGIAIFGPDADAAELEGSKSFAKRIMDSAGVPTGRSARVGSLQEVDAAFAEFGAPYVVKADGLAAGKGVLVTEDFAAAHAHAEYWLNHGSVLIEEFLSGPEVSLFYLSDGFNVLPLSPAQDFKRLLDGDEGPNTGGMGSYSPLPWLKDRFGSEDAFVQEVTDKVALPVIRQLDLEDTPFIGLLYCGLILTEDGIKVIEFNARFGDPETQVVLARMKTPLSKLLFAAATGTLTGVPAPEFSSDAAISVVLASEGYPENTITGRVISGIAAAEATGVQVLHAATQLNDESDFVATGGRVLNVVATGSDLRAAREKAYVALSKITLEGGQYRLDIAQKVAEASQ
ncbi:MAG: phosphoribosylamine--glycine ligase [Microbacteriaceae bacterium]